LLPAAPSQPILLIGYLGWPALVIMLWLDPELAAKVNLVKTASDAVSAFKQDNSTPVTEASPRVIRPLSSPRLP
jgi:hypothetical protein